MGNYHIRKILFPTDFSAASDNALQFAIALAKKCKATLVLLNVIEIPTMSSPDGSFADLGMVSQTILEGSRELLSKTANNILEKQKVQTESYVLQGFLYENIIRASLLYAADIIVVGTSGKLGFVEAILGSNAYRIVNHSNIPVLTVHENVKFRGISKILFPINDEPITLQKADEVICLAKIFNATIEVLGVAADIGKRWIIEEHIMQLDKLIDAKGIRHTRKMIQGDNYGNEILKACNADKEVLVAVASKQEHGMLSLFQHKHDEKLVNHAVVPVLSVPVILE
jgi:nucleotide-binding universal stress UspA family protein